MAFSLRQEVRQTQKLVMTPQMRQSIQLLQMSAMELEELAEQQAMENPFLEIVEEGEETQEEKGQAEEVPEDPEEEDRSAEPDLTTDAALVQGELGASDGGDGTASGEESPDAPGDPEHFGDVDVNWDDVYDGSESRAYSRPDPDEEDRNFEEYVPQRESLYHNLKWQVGVSALDGSERQIAEYIIGCIDDDGYLGVSLDEVAAQIGCTVAAAERVLRIVQTFDPLGVGARNLAECLQIQLEAAGEKDPVVLAIVAGHLDQLQNKRLREIARELKVEESVVHDAFHRISRLEPKPGRSRTADQIKYVMPDVVVKRVDEGHMIYLNEGRVAGMRVNSFYREMLVGGDGFSEAEREFATEKLKGAMWLIRNIEKRKSTILKVAEAVMSFQKDFLDQGTKGLRPLTLREIAEVVGMHESTVARVTTGKYIETPRGIFELKYFFSPGLETDSGEDASSTSIKDMLAQMIEAEDPKRPLSDQRLTEMLQGRGITIARRTVAKYRENMRILSAKLRKQVN